MLIRAKAPLRISFAGGGTDVTPFPETEGGVVLSTTISRYAYGSLCSRNDDIISVESVGSGLSLAFGVDYDLRFDARLSLIELAIRRVSGSHGSGCEVQLCSAAPPGSGLGSSSSLMVALAGLLREYHRLPVTEQQTAQLAWEIERRDLGIPGGMQDHYAATFGGLNFFEFGPCQVTVNPLHVSDSIINELELNLLLCYTGVTRQSAQIIADQTARVRARDPSVLESLRNQKELATTMKTALLRGDLSYFGELLGQAWHEKKKMSPMITTALIDEIYELALRRGAVGGKVTGAGGGGHVLLYCDFSRRHRLAEALEKFGATVIEFGFERSGLTTWRA